jgi:hypothetical protein
MSYSFFKISTPSACRIAALIITGAAIATAFSINKLEIGGVDIKDYINRDGEIDWVRFHCDRPAFAQAYLEKGPRYLNAETPGGFLQSIIGTVSTQGIELAKQLVDYCASITQQCNTPTQQCPTNASQTPLSLEGKDMSGLTMLSQILHCCTP